MAVHIIGKDGGEGARWSRKAPAEDCVGTLRCAAMAGHLGKPNGDKPSGAKMMCVTMTTFSRKFCIRALHGDLHITAETAPTHFNYS